MKIRVEEQEFRGRPILAIFNEDAKEEYKNYALVKLGTYKASAILAAIDQIKTFVEKHRS